MINATHKILSQLQPSSPSLVATMPTPRIENIFGYDTAFESWKLFLCQYKRPYCDNGRYYYYLDITQNIKLHFWTQNFSNPCAFFPLVLAKSDQHLAQINSRLLDNVIFVDVMSVWPISTQIRVQGIADVNIRVEYKIRKGPWVSIPTWYHWNEIEMGIKECSMGGLMKLRNKVTESSESLRRTVYSLEENNLPDWWESRAERVLEDRFEGRSPKEFLGVIGRMLAENRTMEKPTTIVSQSFRAFVYPMAV